MKNVIKVNVVALPNICPFSCIFVEQMDVVTPQLYRASPGVRWHFVSVLVGGRRTDSEQG
jgi:hypothetical protein